MKNNFILKLILTFIIISIIIWFIYRYSNNTRQIGETNYDSTRTSQNILSNEQNELTENNTQTETNSTDENTSNTITNTISATENETNTPPSQNTQKTEPSSKETEIASFTTKIYTKDSDRQKNITLACSTLDNTTVENGKTFSFSNTVGKATSKKGYKKADVFKNGDVIEALGGGLCQVSTTLYNAVLKVPNTKVTERHSHSNKVPYIKSGKDAAVSYGTYDFKFVNNTGNTLKIKASNTKNNVTVKILKIE